jgi:hypothetical protein
MSDHPTHTPEQRVKFHMAMGEFDELWLDKADIHIERMDDAAFWIGFYPEVGPELMLNTGVYRGEWYFNIYEDVVGDGRDISVRRPRNSKTPISKRNPRLEQAALDFIAQDNAIRELKASMEPCLIREPFENDTGAFTSSCDLEGNELCANCQRRKDNRAEYKAFLRKRQNAKARMRTWARGMK